MLLIVVSSSSFFSFLAGFASMPESILPCPYPPSLLLILTLSSQHWWSQGPRFSSVLCSASATCHMSRVTCHMSHVTCHITKCAVAVLCYFMGSSFFHPSLPSFHPFNPKYQRREEKDREEREELPDIQGCEGAAPSLDCFLLIRALSSLGRV